MKLKMAFALLVTTLFMGAVASATPTPPCAGPTLQDVISLGLCTIGDKTFDFVSGSGGLENAETGATITLTASQLSFTPVNGASGPGFQIDGLPGTTSTTATAQYNFFIGTFSVTAPSGQEITATPVMLNGAVVVATNGFSRSQAELSNSAFDFYGGSGTVSHISGAGGGFPETSFSGTFTLENQSNQTTAGSVGSDAASFLNAQFNFTELPASTPEPSSLLLFGSGLLMTAGALRRKWLTT